MSRAVQPAQPQSTSLCSEEEQIFNQKVQVVIDRVTSLTSQGRVLEVAKLSAMLELVHGDLCDYKRALAQPPQPFTSTLAVLVATDKRNLGFRGLTVKQILKAVKRRVQRLVPESPLLQSPKSVMTMVSLASEDNSGVLDLEEIMKYSLHAFQPHIPGFCMTLESSYNKTDFDEFISPTACEEMEIFRIALMEQGAWPELFDSGGHES